MELDDQLAALAAGELDDDTARALRARAARDPALARRLARHEELQRWLEDWTAPAMGAEATSRLRDRVDEALAALGDGPLTGPAQSTGTPATPAPLADRDEEAATPAAAGAVVDMAAARDRRRERRGLPAWAPGAAVAAALAAVVGTGLVLGGLPSASDMDVMADGGADETAVEDSTSDDSADEAAMAESAPAEDMDAQDMGDGESTAALAARERNVVIPEGELLALVDRVDRAATTSSGSSGSDDSAGDTDDESAEEASWSTEECVAIALERDTADAPDRDVAHVATGTYADRDAIFVVVRTPAEGSEDRFEVLAYDPTDCSLLARDETTR